MKCKHINQDAKKKDPHENILCRIYCYAKFTRYPNLKQE